MGCNPPDQVLCSNRSASGQGVREARRGDRPEGGLKTRESPPLQDGEYVKFKNLESGGDTSSAEGPVTACCPPRHGSASAMEPHSVARKGRAGSGRTARLGSHRHPREKSSAPPWSKPLLTSNQPWAQKRNAATTANPTQSGQWVRPMQIIRLPQLDGAGPPGANPWRESRQFCTSPVPSAPCCKLSVPRRSRQQGGTVRSRLAALAWPRRRRGSKNRDSHRSCLQESGERERREQPVACRESFP